MSELAPETEHLPRLGESQFSPAQGGLIRHACLRLLALQKVWHPSAGRLLAGSAFLAPVNHAQHLGSTWRHYEEITMPDGLVVLGDAICSLNPTYGQGMTAAVIEATQLGQLLTERAAAAGFTQHVAAVAAAAPASAVSADRSPVGSGLGQESPSSSQDRIRSSSTTRVSSMASSISGSSSTVWLAGLNQQLQQAVLPDIKGAWDMAVRSDLRFPGATTNEAFKQSRVERLAMTYVASLFKLASVDQEVRVRLWQVGSKRYIQPPA